MDERGKRLLGYAPLEGAMNGAMLRACIERDRSRHDRPRCCRSRPAFSFLEQIPCLEPQSPPPQEGPLVARIVATVIRGIVATGIRGIVATGIRGIVATVIRGIGTTVIIAV